MSNLTLRGLAKDYAKGVIDKDKYRKSRTELIKGIIAGEITVKAIDYDPPLMPSTSDKEEDVTAKSIERNRAKVKPKPTPQSAPVNQSADTQDSNKSPMIFISVGSVIVLSLIIAVFLFYPKPPGTASIETSHVSKSSNIVNDNDNRTVTSMAGESLIADFLTQKNWNEDSLDKFIESWSALTQEERNSAKQTKRMQRMNDSIYKQFLEGKALASIDSEKAIMKQQKLIEFAEAIGIDDSRLILDGD